MIPRWLLIIGMACSSTAFAQDTATKPTTPPAQEPTFEDQVVVSASRVEEELVNAPAAVTLITAESLQNAPSTNMGDVLRLVPGVNVTQVSARDVNVTSRGASSSLATSQLALVDGRPLYLDFFGMVMWDLVPATTGDIDRIEVIRGPASAVWGANALAGVINVITRTPRQAAAGGSRTALTMSAGGFGRTVNGVDPGSGSLFSVDVSHARIVNDRWSFRASAGYAVQDALPRPNGLLPSGTPYPPYANTGARQPKASVRADYDLQSGGRVVIEGGVAGTAGIIHTGIGPAHIERGSRLGYAAARYEKGGRRVAVFSNLLHGNAATLLTGGLDLRPIPLDFDTKTFDVEVADLRTVGQRHALSYGGNYRHNAFELSMAPAGEDRNEGGVYLQDEIFINDHLRWTVGGRVDAFSSIDGAVFSPRTSLLIKPAPAHSFRLSFNRAFRSPSLVNNHLDITIVTPVVLPVIGPFAFPTRAVGDPELEPETLTAYEVGYTGIVRNRALLSAAVYWNSTKDSIHFTPVEAYSPLNPPPGWPLPPQFVPLGQLPSRYTYVNLGTVRDKGIELGVEAAVTRMVTAFVNYSHQWQPDVSFPAPFTVNDVNWPARHRTNAGVTVSSGRYLGSVSVHVSSEAYWQDVLDARFAGTTDDYALLNARFGVKWSEGRVITSVKGTNLGNQQVMQHIFGDVLRRQVVGEVSVGF